MMRLFKFLPASIAKKVILMNAVALFALGGVILGAYALTRQTKNMTSALINQHLPQVINNARLCRNINQVRADIQQTVNTFTLDEDVPKKETERILPTLEELQNFAGKKEGLSDALTQFSDAVRSVLLRCGEISVIQREVESLEAELSRQIATLELNVMGRILSHKLSGKEYELRSLEQVIASTPDSRNLLLEISILRADCQQACLSGNLPAADWKEHATSMLQNLESIFNAVMNAGEELASIGEQLINTLSKYEIELFRLGQALLEMQRELEALHRSRSAVQSIIETMDADVAMTTNHMETQLAANARRSTNMILLLSLLAAAMLAGLAIYGFKIARPIQELTVSASEIAAGDLDHPITTSGSDETGVLGRSFAQMRDAIKDKINALAVKNEELRASEVRYRALVEDTPVLICRFRPNGEIIYANDAYCRQVGETIQGANSGAFLEQVHEEDREKARKALATLSAETPIHSLEFRMIGKEGEPRWHRWIHHALFNAQGEMLACQSIGEDIEERKQAEAERAQLEAQLIQSHKLQAVGQLAGGIAHDFNNMLHVILGHSSLALDKLEAGGEIQLELNAITKAAQSAASLVTQLLAFSRRQVLTLTDLNLNDVIINTLKMIQRVIGENIVLDVIPGHHLGAIYADKVQIEQILMNLCVNARDAMPGGGTITLKTENVLLNDEFCKVHNMDAPGSYVQLSVTDTGCGMDVETLSHIFEPFFTTKEIGAGTGFGLATVYGIIKQHQGIILAESEMGEGTTFRIYLPFSSGQASKPRNVEKKAAPGGAETILLAEDEDAVRRLCQLLLEKAGYIVLPAVDGEEAIQVFEEHEDEIDLALLDVMMPKLGGKAVYDRIKEKRPDVQVIFSSGYSADSIHTDFILNQDMQLIQKPYNRETLLNIIRKTLDAEA